MALCSPQAMNWTGLYSGSGEYSAPEDRERRDRIPRRHHRENGPPRHWHASLGQLRPTASQNRSVRMGAIRGGSKLPLQRIATPTQDSLLLYNDDSASGSGIKAKRQWSYCWSILLCSKALGDQPFMFVARFVFVARVSRCRRSHSPKVTNCKAAMPIFWRLLYVSRCKRQI